MSAIAITKKKSDGSIQYSVQIDCLQVAHVQIIGTPSSVLTQILSSLPRHDLSFFLHDIQSPNHHAEQLLVLNLLPLLSADIHLGCITLYV